MSKRRYYLLIALLVLFSLVFGGCATNRIYEEQDIVYSKKRFELKLEYTRQPYKSPLIRLEQSIVKEATADSSIYTVYDVLVLNNSSYKIDDKFFMIIDDEVFPMEILTKELENSKILVEKKDKVATSDSTSVEVVTGYSENNTKITRFTYRLSYKVINKIISANEVMFRYYAGPDMLTIKLNGVKLQKIKTLINRV